MTWHMRKRIRQDRPQYVAFFGHYSLRCICGSVVQIRRQLARFRWSTFVDTLEVFRADDMGCDHPLKHIARFLPGARTRLLKSA